MKSFLTLLFILGFTQQAAHSENLIEILQLAVKNDPQYLAAIARNRSVHEKVVQARANLLPEISAVGQIEQSDGESIQSNIAFGSESETTLLNVSLNQVIYNHGNYKLLSQAKKQVEQDKVSLEAELQNLIIRSAEAYLNILSAKDELTFAKAETKAIGQQLEQTNQRYDVGLIAITDVHQAQADFDRALADEILAQNTLDNAREALREITGRFHRELSGLSERLELVTPTPANADKWVAIAAENNLNLKAQKIALEIAREQIKLSESAHYPTLSFSAEYTDRTNETPEGIIVSGFDGTTIGLSLSVPLFAGFDTVSRTRESRHLFDQSSHNLELAHRQAQRNTRSAYLGVVAGISSVKALSQSLISNQSALEATQAGFEVGTKTIVDVLLATRGLFQAKSLLSRAKYDYILNVLRLRQAAGILTKEDLVKVNSWLQ